MPVIKRKTRILRPAQMIVISFLAVITIGTFLLMLPISSKSGTFTNVVDCIFTASSATCVTGISLFDTYQNWTIFGQIVILMLIQVGGIGFLTMVTFFNLIISRKKMGLIRTNEVLGDISSTTGIPTARRLFSRIIAYTMVLEFVGMLIIMIKLVPKYGGYGAFMSIFLSISAFCNAGFDVMGIEGSDVGLSNYTGEPLILITVMVLIIIGGLGFIVWDDLTSFKKKKKLSVHTKTVLITSGILIFAGALIYFFIQLITPSVYGEYPVGEQVLTSFFGSVSSRTAGFVAAPLPTGTEFGKIITMLLMFIGAAPGSTGGGIKVTTFAIVVMTILSVIRSKSETELLGHRIKREVVYKATTVLGLALGFIFTAFIAIFFVEHGANNAHAIDVLFDTVSCFTTTGFTSGIAASGTDFTKIVLSICMFVGRVGPVSLLMSLTLKSHDDKNTVMPMTDLAVG